MTPRPHGSEERAREWTIYRPKHSAVRGVIGPPLKQGEHVRVVEAPVSPPSVTDRQVLLERAQKAEDAWANALARVAVLETALEPFAPPKGKWPSFIDADFDRARRALRGSVPAGEETDV